MNKLRNVVKPFDAVHHPYQSENSQNENNVQDLSAGEMTRYNANRINKLMN